MNRWWRVELLLTCAAVLVLSGCAATLARGALVGRATVPAVLRTGVGATAGRMAAGVAAEELMAARMAAGGVRLAGAARAGTVRAMARGSRLVGVFEELTAARSMSRAALRISAGRIASNGQIVLTATESGLIRLPSGEVLGRVRGAGIFDVSGTQVGEFLAPPRAIQGTTSMELVRVRHGWYHVALDGRGGSNLALLALATGHEDDRCLTDSANSVAMRGRRLLATIDEVLAR